MARRLRTGSPLVGSLLLLAALGSWTRGPLDLEFQAVHAYRSLVSPWMGYTLTCRFQPTCSEYALQVLQEKGFWAGNLKIGQRLLRCSPLGLLYSAGGVSFGQAQARLRFTPRFFGPPPLLRRVERRLRIPGSRASLETRIHPG